MKTSPYYSTTVSRYIFFTQKLYRFFHLLRVLNIFYLYTVHHILYEMYINNILYLLHVLFSGTLDVVYKKMG